MAASGETIAAMSARDVAFACDKIAWRETLHAIADAIDDPDKFVADSHRYRDRLLRPRVPVIYMYVRSADRRLQNANEHVVVANFGNRNFLEPKTRLGFALHDRLHRFLHELKLGADQEMHVNSEIGL